WGGNGSGQLGDGTLSTRLSPQQVGTVSVWSSVSAGALYTCAVRTDGTLWCWGVIAQALGYDDSLAVTGTPLQVGGGNTWAAVSTSRLTTVGNPHTCAVRTDGTLWCWGYANWAVLDITAQEGYLIPPTRVGVASTWSRISSGERADCATQADGS